MDSSTLGNWKLRGLQLSVLMIQGRLICIIALFILIKNDCVLSSGVRKTVQCVGHLSRGGFRSHVG